MPQALSMLCIRGNICRSYAVLQSLFTSREGKYVKSDKINRYTQIYILEYNYHWQEKKK